MSATFDDIKKLVSRYLANTSTNDYSTVDREAEINNVVRNELMQYKEGRWPQLKTAPTDIVFTSGVAGLPSDFHGDYRLYEESSDGRIQQEYDKTDQDKFIDNIEYTYTIQKVSGTQSLKIYPEDSVTLKIVYYAVPITADMSDGDDETGFSESYNVAIAKLVAANLMETKNPEDNRIHVYRYGSNHEEHNPASYSAYGRLETLWMKEKKKIKSRFQTVNNVYDRDTFYSKSFFGGYRGRRR